jgi:hypothetical protein
MSNEFETIFGTAPEKIVIIKAKGDQWPIREAENVLRDEGFTTGMMQAGAPMGFARGADYVAKWRNIPPDQYQHLDGIITGDFRDGPVTIKYRKG